MNLLLLVVMWCWRTNFFGEKDKFGSILSRDVSTLTVTWYGIAVFDDRFPTKCYAPQQVDVSRLRQTLIHFHDIKLNGQEQTVCSDACICIIHSFRDLWFPNKDI